MKAKSSQHHLLRVLPQILKDAGGEITDSYELKRALGYHAINGDVSNPILKALKTLKRQGVLEYEYMHMPDRRPAYKFRATLCTDPMQPEPQPLSLEEENQQTPDQIIEMGLRLIAKGMRTQIDSEQDDTLKKALEVNNLEWSEKFEKAQSEKGYLSKIFGNKQS